MPGTTETTDTVQDLPASQDAKTIVPMSLSLVAKKEKILQTEAAKLEKLLIQRNEILNKLQERHEYLLITNGQLQETRRHRREKLTSLRTLLEREDEHVILDLSHTTGLNELKAIMEKCGVLREILLGLVDKRSALEQRCMGLEEQESKETTLLMVKMEYLNEARNTLCLFQEEIVGIQWNLENDHVELAKEERRLNATSNDAQRIADTVEKLEAVLRAQMAAVEELRTALKNFERMAHEEQRQLVVTNEEARSKQRELHKYLKRDGPTCLADEEVLQSANDLQSRLQQLNDEVSRSAFYKRELALRRKQEKDMVSVTQSRIKAKNEQLKWLQSHLAHLENKRKEIAISRAANQASYLARLKDHKETLTLLKLQNKDVEKQLKTTERAITSLTKKIATTSKKISQKSKILAECKAKMKAKRDQVAKSAATQELIDAEVLSLQTQFDQEQDCFEQTKNFLTTLEMESEELRSSCTSLQTEFQQRHMACATIKDKIIATNTSVNKHTQEIRTKFLSNFVVDDADKLMGMLEKEIETRAAKDMAEIKKVIAHETKALNDKYDQLANETRKYYANIVRKKEKQYNAKLEELMAQKKVESGKSIEKKHVTATGHGRVEEEMLGELNPSWIEGPSNPSADNKPKNAQKAKTSKQTQRKAKESKSARRQLAPGLNLVDDSPKTDHELIDVKPVQSKPLKQRQNTNRGRSCLRRRTPAEKAGKAEPKPLSSTTNQSPETVHSSAFRSDHSDPIAGVSSQDSGCGNDTIPDVTKHDKSSTKKSHVRKVDRGSKGVIKSMKVSHRASKVIKPNRISLGQTVDWAATDTFSFD